MFRDIYRVLRRELEDGAAAMYYTEIVLEMYSYLTQQQIESAGKVRFSDAVEKLLDEDNPRPHMFADVISAIMRKAKIKDINESAFTVSGDRLFVGSINMVDVIQNVVPGRWSVLLSWEKIAAFANDGEFDDSDGHYDLSQHDKSGYYGLWADTGSLKERSEASGSCVTPDGVTIKALPGTIKSACHRRSDGVCDAVFISERS